MRPVFSFARIAIALGILLSLLLVWLSFISFEVFRAFFDSVASDGDADRITLELHQSAVFGTRILALGWCFILIPLYYFVDQINFGYNPVQEVRKCLRAITNWIRHEQHFHLFVLATACLAGSWVRIYHLFQPMRSDESWTFLHFVSEPFIVAISLYTSPNNHLLHTALAHISIEIFGDAPWALRLPALAAGILLIPAVYLLFRRLSGKTVGLLAAVLVSIWPILIDYSTNARGYSLIMLFTVIIFIAADRMRRKSSANAHIIFAVVAALGLYTTPIFAFPLGAAGIWLLSLMPLNKIGISNWAFIKHLCWTALAAMILVLLLYSPILITTGTAKIVANDTVLHAGSNVFADMFGSLQKAWTHFTMYFHPIFRLAIVTGLVTSIIRAPLSMTMLWLCITIWSAALVIVLEVSAPFRVWLFSLPLVLGYVAAGWVTLLKHERFISITTALILVCSTTAILSKEPGTFYKSFGAFPEAEAIVLYLDDKLGNNNGLVTSFPANQSMSYYAKLHNIDTQITTARKRAMNQAIKRLFVVVSPPHSNFLDLLEYKDRYGDSNFLSRDYEVISTMPIHETSVVMVQVIEPNQEMRKSY